MKKFTNGWLQELLLPKISLKVKLTTIILIVSLFKIQANTYSQSTKLTLKLDNVTVEQAFDEIEAISEFRFLFETEKLNLHRKVNLDVQKKNIKHILRLLFKNTGVKYKIMNRQVLLSKGTEKIKGIDENSKTVDDKATQLQVKGTVLDANGVPLAGANIIEKGTTNGTQTDFDGNFSINVESSDAVLEISYIGFETKVVALNGQSTITVNLIESTSGLDEVVVVAYGAQSKRKLTGAVSTVSTEDIVKISAANTTNLLQGRAAGVKIESNGGAPGAGVSVVIRGTGTFGNDQPLYVVDGNIVNGIDFLNPNDIKDISVLKDAAAAALYGNRASNGVVLITTKKGTRGDIRINIESKIGVQSATNTLDLLNARQYADYHNQASDNDGLPRAVPNDSGFDPSIDTDFQDLTINSALYQEYSFNASGGGENGTFYVSGQYLDQEGIVVDSDFQRYNFSVNSTLQKGRFKLTENLIISRQVSNPNNFFGRERGEIPTIPVFNENNLGGFAGIEPAFHGVARGINWYGLAQLHDNKFTTDRIVASLQPEFEIMEGLVYKANLGINYSVFHNFVFNPEFFLSTSQEAFNDIARLTESYTRTLSTLIENTLSYNKSFGDHNLGLLAGYTIQETRSRNAGGAGTEFDFNADFQVLSAANDDTDVFGSLQENALVSYLGRLNYDYKGKYILGATVRRDGSSRFTEENRWGVFPSFSGAWILSEENFFPDDGLVNFVKLRGSYGELGSQNIGNYEISSVLNNTNFYNLGGNVLSGGIVRGLANPNLVWETTKTTNFAIDTELFDSKLSITAEYFIRESEDILANVPIPSAGGLGFSLRNNAATIENKGFEFLATYRHASKNPDGFNFNASLNFTTIDNEVLALGDGVNPINGGTFTQQTFLATRTDVGGPVGAFFGYVTEGLYQSQAEIDADGRTGDAQLGDINFVDLDNDGDIDGDDRQVLGSPVPNFELGLNFDATYKNFDLSLFIQGVQGNDVWNAIRFSHILDGSGGNKLADILDAWTPQNTNTNIPRVSLNDPAGNRRSSDFYIEDGSYIRLKAIQLGYSLPESVISSTGMSNARIYLSGQNLITITDYSGYDPEIGRSLNGSLFDTGVDARAYPQAKTVIFGVQLSF